MRLAVRLRPDSQGELTALSNMLGGFQRQGKSSAVHKKTKGSEGDKGKRARGRESR